MRRNHLSRLALSAFIVSAGAATGAPAASAEAAFQCTAVAQGASLNLTWNYDGPSDSYIRKDGSYVRTVANGENQTTIYNDGSLSVRVWEQGAPIDVPCTTDIFDWSNTCTLSSDGTTASWDRPPGMGPETTYYLRKNGAYLATVDAQTSYNLETPATDVDTISVRYWDRGTRHEAVCAASDATGELSQVASPTGFSTHGHSPAFPAVLTASNGTVYIEGTDDGTSRGTYVVIAKDAASNSMTEVYRTADNAVVRRMLAVNSTTNTFVFEAYKPGVPALFYRVVQGETVTDHYLSDLNIEFTGEVTLTDGGTLYGQGDATPGVDDRDDAELVSFNTTTGESGLVKDGNGTAKFEPQSLVTSGDKLFYTAVVAKQRIAFVHDTTTGGHSPMSGSWSNTPAMSSGIAVGSTAGPTWLEHGDGDKLILSGDLPIDVTVYDGPTFASEIIRTDTNIYMAVQPAIVGAETLFMRYEVASGTLVNLGTHPTSWNLTYKGFVQLSLDGDDLLFAADPLPAEELGARVFRITE